MCVRVRVLVGLVEGLDGLFEDRLHPWPPLVPEAPCDAHHRVCCAIPVGEDAGVEQVDARRAPLIGEVDQPHPVGYLLRDLLQESAHQVGVGVDHDDGVSVPARCLLPSSCVTMRWCMRVDLPMRVLAT